MIRKIKNSLKKIGKRIDIIYLVIFILFFVISTKSKIVISSDLISAIYSLIIGTIFRFFLKEKVILNPLLFLNILLLLGTIVLIIFHSTHLNNYVLLLNIGGAISNMFIPFGYGLLIGELLLRNCPYKLEFTDLLAFILQIIILLIMLYNNLLLVRKDIYLMLILASIILSLMYFFKCKRIKC